MPDHFRHARRRRSVAAALDADRAIGHNHAHSGQVSFLNAVQEILSRGLLGRIEEDETRLPSCPDQPAIETAHLRCIASCQANSNFCGNLSQ